MADQEEPARLPLESPAHYAALSTVRGIDTAVLWKQGDTGYGLLFTEDDSSRVPWGPAATLLTLTRTRVWSHALEWPKVETRSGKL